MTLVYGSMLDPSGKKEVKKLYRVSGNHLFLMMKSFQKGHKKRFFLKILMKIFFDNENPPGAEKNIFASIMFFLYENLLFNGMTKNHNFEGQKERF